MGYASLGQEIMPEEDRGDISSVHPTGFENKEYPFVENGYGVQPLPSGGLHAFRSERQSAQSSLPEPGR